MSLLVRQVGVVVNKFIRKNLPVSNSVASGLRDDLIEVASHHSYVETFSQRADSWHRALGFTSSSEWAVSFSDIVKGLLPEDLKGPIRLAIDITEEPYYGKPTIQTVTWTGEKGIRAWWKFAVITLVDSSMKKTVPLACVPFMLGSNLADTIEKLIDLSLPILPGIDLVLCDRGFYSGEVIDVFNRRKIPYLILVPKNKLVRPMADQCRCTSQWAVIPHTMKWKGNKSSHTTETNLIILCDDTYDWSWATNLDNYHISGLVRKYRTRWRIETLFRVQDESKIKTKSTRGIVRYVTFLISLLITGVWAVSNRTVPFIRWIADAAKLTWITRLIQTQKLNILE